MYQTPERDQSDDEQHAAKLLPLKGDGSKRTIPLLPELRTVLWQLRKDALAGGPYGSDRFVFQTAERTPLYYRNVPARGLDTAADRAALNEAASTRSSGSRATAGHL
jgi:hypothetical protein